jgi:hypothetical protein
VPKTAEQRLLDVLPGHIRRLNREIKARKRRPSGKARRDAGIIAARDLQVQVLELLRRRQR